MKVVSVGWQLSDTFKQPYDREQWTLEHWRKQAESHGLNEARLRDELAREHRRVAYWKGRAKR